VHILPDAFDKLGSPCLIDGPWQKFPFTGLIAMLAAIATLVVDTIATGYFQRAQAAKTAAVVGDVETSGGHAHDGHGHDHGHAHGMSSVVAAASTSNGDDSGQLIRHRVISQVSIEQQCMHRANYCFSYYKLNRIGDYIYTCSAFTRVLISSCVLTLCSHLINVFQGAGAGDHSALGDHRDVCRHI
jgi:hypothetical protein